MLLNLYFFTELKRQNFKKYNCEKFIFLYLYKIVTTLETSKSITSFQLFRLNLLNSELFQKSIVATFLVNTLKFVFHLTKDFD